MLGIAGLLGVMVGGIIAYFAERLPAQTEVLETLAGVLMIGGFALTTLTLPAIL